MSRILMAALIMLLGTGLVGVAGIYNAVQADSWGTPEPMDFETDNGLFNFHITPAVAATEEGEKVIPSKGILSKIDKEGKAEQLWSADLPNPVQPVEAIVASDGSYVVTFDDWGTVGMTDNVVVLFGKSGQQIARYSLEDLLTAEEIKKVDHTVSSRMWMNESASFDLTKKQLILPTIRTIRINLEDGKILK